MRRRAFLSAVFSTMAWPLAATAQQNTNAKRLAIFSPSEPSANLHPRTESTFSQGFLLSSVDWGRSRDKTLR
jgi:hypothetical protein